MRYGFLKIRLGWCFLLVFWMTLPPATAAIECSSAPLPEPPSGREISVKNVEELQRTVRSAEPGSVILLAPGEYRLKATLSVRTDIITLRGNGEACGDVRVRGAGMDEANYGGAPHGIWTDASGLMVQNLTIADFYQHGVVLNPGAESPTFQNIRILDTGKQMIKVNPTGFGDGVDGGLVEHSVFAYTEGPPKVDHGGGTGYTNGVDVHAGANWIIRNNHFENFHTPDHADHLWAPAVLMWNGARDTVVENNRFVDVDRAIAFGLLSRPADHSGGVIRNNYIEYSKGLYSAERRSGSDAAIIVWSSPGTIVEENEVLTRGNPRLSIEFRFDTSGAKALDNTVDAPIGRRDGGDYKGAGNTLITE
jgi:pectate lyase